MIAKILENPLLSKFVDRRTFGQITRYLITGVSSASIEITLFFILTHHFFVGTQPPELTAPPILFSQFIHYLMDIGLIVADKINVFYANIISLTIVFWFNFLANRFFSFRSKTPILRQLRIYGPLFFFNLGATSVIVGFLVNHLDIFPVFAKAISIGCVVSWNFLTYKLIIFK